MAGPARSSPQQNHLLDALPTSDYERLASHLELVPMSLGEVLYESGARLRYVYFPTTSIVPLLYVMEDGASAEIAVVGNEGILGISLFMGGDTTPNRVVDPFGFDTALDIPRELFAKNQILSADRIGRAQEQDDPSPDVQDDSNDCSHQRSMCSSCQSRPRLQAPARRR